MKKLIPILSVLLIFYACKKGSGSSTPSSSVFNANYYFFDSAVVNYNPMTGSQIVTDYSDSTIAAIYLDSVSNKLVYKGDTFTYSTSTLSYGNTGGSHNHRDIILTTDSLKLSWTDYIGHAEELKTILTGYKR